jgi:hypothetical protein
MSALLVLISLLWAAHLATADPADLVWSSYLGGTNMDNNYALALDGSGNTYVTGPTLSTDFPATAGAYDETHNSNWDITVAKFNADGSGLVYATYLGGTNGDHSYGLVLDDNGNAYLTGYTYSTDFPITAGVVQDTFAGGSWDAYVTRLNAAGTDLDYSTFLGGSYNDAGYGIDVDGAGNVTLIGRTQSQDYPVTDAAFDTTHHGGGDVMVTRLDATATALVYSTFLGGYSDEYGRSVVLDGSGNAYLSGRTESPDFPVTPAGYDTTHNGWTDVFVVKLNAAGSGLDYGTFLGGSEQDDGFNITIDATGKAYIIGGTKSTNFPVTAGAFDETKNGGEDAFLVQLNASGSDLDYGTFVGGTSDDQGYDIDLDASGKAYLIGHTYSTGFPVTADAYDTTHNGSRDVFVIKHDLSTASNDYATFLGGSSWEYGYGIAQDGAGNVHLSGSTNSADFPVTAGVYKDTLDGYSDTWVAKLNIGVTVAYGAMAGNVSEDGGGPIEGAIVSATGPSSGTDTTDAGGNYLIGMLLPGSYDVTATAAGYYPETQNGITVVADDTTTVDFLLELQVGAIAGNVSENGGGPIEGAVVDAVGPSSGSDTTDASGNYIIEDLLPGSYDVTATATGYDPDTQDTITVVADDTTTVDFLLTPIVVAPPEAVDDLTAMLSKTDIILQWSAVTTDTGGAPLVVDLYRVFRDTVPGFTPGTPLDSTTGPMFTDDTGVVGNTGVNYYYVVTAVTGGEESVPSNEVGEFDTDLLIVP